MAPRSVFLPTMVDKLAGNPPREMQRKTTMRCHFTGMAIIKKRDGHKCRRGSAKLAWQYTAGGKKGAAALKNMAAA